MPPRRQPQKRKAQEEEKPPTGRQAAKKPKRTDPEHRRRSPRLSAAISSDEEGRDSRQGVLRGQKTGTKGNLYIPIDEYEYDTVRDHSRDFLTYARFQQKSKKEESNKAKKFLSDFRKKVRLETSSTMQIASGGVVDALRTPKKIHGLLAKSLKEKQPHALTRALPETGSLGSLDNLPLRQIGIEILTVAREALDLYDSSNTRSKDVRLSTPALQWKQDHRNLAETISVANQIAQEFVGLTMSPTEAGRPPNPVPGSKETTQVAFDLLKQSLEGIAKESWGKKVWDLWKSLDCVTRVLQGK